MRYSGAEAQVAAFAEARGIPLCETIAGKSAVTHDHPAHVGPIGIVGSTSANAMAAEADLILAIGTRLMDFTTGSWTAFAPEAKFISINAARWDADQAPRAGRGRRRAGDGDGTRRGTRRLGRGCELGEKGRLEFAKWNDALDGYQKPTNDPIPTYAQVVGVVNAKAGERDLLITAAGGLPGEVMKNWR